jgi:hypothetical protein
VLDVWVVVAGNADGDTTRLHRLRYFAHQDDREHAVLDVRALYLDVFRQVEYAPERPHRDPLVQELAITPVGLAPFNRELVGLNSKGDVVGGEAGQRHRDPVLVLAGALDVVQRVAVAVVGGVIHPVQ